MFKRRSWKTTLAGIGALATAIATGGVQPETIATIIAAVGLIFSKDGKAVNKED